MVRELTCSCDKSEEMKVDSIEMFLKLKDYFAKLVDEGILIEIPVTEPYFVGKSKLQTINWYADKWYFCKRCGCLWEFVYPDVPASGFIRKFQNGMHQMVER